MNIRKPRKQIKDTQTNENINIRTGRSRAFSRMATMDPYPILGLPEDLEPPKKKKIRKARPVRVGLGFSECYIEKDYGAFTMSFQRLGGFQKYVHKLKKRVEPGMKDILRFRLDAYNAAQRDEKVADFLEEHFDLMFS